MTEHTFKVILLYLAWDLHQLDCVYYRNYRHIQRSLQDVGVPLLLVGKTPGRFSERGWARNLQGWPAFDSSHHDFVGAPFGQSSLKHSQLLCLMASLRFLLASSYAWSFCIWSILPAEVWAVHRVFCGRLIEGWPVYYSSNGWVFYWHVHLLGMDAHMLWRYIISHGEFDRLATFWWEVCSLLL